MSVGVPPSSSRYNNRYVGADGVEGHQVANLHHTSNNDNRQSSSSCTGVENIAATTSSKVALMQEDHDHAVALGRHTPSPTSSSTSSRERSHPPLPSVISSSTETAPGLSSGTRNNKNGELPFVRIPIASHPRPVDAAVAASHDEVPSSKNATGRSLPSITDVFPHPRRDTEVVSTDQSFLLEHIPSTCPICFLERCFGYGIINSNLF